MEKEREKKILVVDDDESIRRTFFLILYKNYQVYPVKDSKEAFQRFLGSDVDLIIADFRLPHCSGLKVIEKFRESGFTGKAILISAFPDLVKSEELARLSVDYFFIKPLDLEALIHSINCLLNKNQESRKKNVLKSE